MASANVSGTSFSFAYDVFGRRITDAMGNQLAYDGANAVEEISGGSVVSSRFTGGIDEFFSRTDSSGTFSPLADALGSVVALTDSTGALQTQYTYEPFGNTTVSGPANANSFQYTGRENDGTGLYYYRARYYSPIYQRFISEDPLGFAGGVNFYAYTGDNPVGFSDPFGLKPNRCQAVYCSPWGWNPWGGPNHWPGNGWGPPGAPNPWAPPGSAPDGNPNPPDCSEYGIDCNAQEQFLNGLVAAVHGLEQPFYPILIGGGMMVAGATTGLAALGLTWVMPAALPATLPVMAGGAWLFYEGVYYAWNGTMWIPP